MVQFTLRPEGAQIEYKKSMKQLPKDFWETYSAFANTEGGMVVLGISETEPGVQNVEKVKKELFNSLQDDRKVSYNLISERQVNVRYFDEKAVIEILVPAAPASKKPIHINRDLRQTYKRKNDGDYKATPEELKYMLRNSERDLDSDTHTEV